jgi:hypothetical protein
MCRDGGFSYNGYEKPPSLFLRVNRCDVAEEKTADPILTQLHSLYRMVDSRASDLAGIHGGRLRCARGCCDCCVDDISVNEAEAHNIRARYPDLLAAGAPNKKGSCAFLDEAGACRIYDARPYVCRTQGLPLHWVEELDDGTMVAMRDICPLNDAGTPVENLDENDCWIIGPVEAVLARLQQAVSGGKMVRISLRDLFSGT